MRCFGLWSAWRGGCRTLRAERLSIHRAVGEARGPPATLVKRMGRLCPTGRLRSERTGATGPHDGDTDDRDHQQRDNQTDQKHFHGR